MSYRLAIRYSPVYELLNSLHAYSDRSLKVLELGAGWVREVDRHLPAGFAEQARFVEKTGFPYELVELCPAGDDPAAFIDWLGQLPLGELYERLLTIELDPARLPPDLGAARDRCVAVFRTWYEAYLKSLDPRILRGLAENARGHAAVLGQFPAAEAVEQITGGIILEPGPGLEEVLLVPQYHCRPLNLFSWTTRRCIIGYPADVLPPAPGALPADLRSLTRALADDSRLQILKFLAGGVRSFTDTVRFTGLAKSTVHHHMVTLRSCGLIRVHVRPDGADRYSFRPEAIDRITPRLHAFLKEE